MCSTFVFLCGMMGPLRAGADAIGRPATFVQLKTSEVFAALCGKSNPLYKGRVLCGVPILFGPSREKNEGELRRAALNGYDYVSILTYNDGALVASNHPLSKRAHVTRADLLEFPIVSSSIEQLAPLSEYLGAGHISAAIADLATRLQVIQDGQSIMFMPPFSDVARDDRYRFLPIEDAYEVEAGFVYDRAAIDPAEVSAMLSPAVTAFTSFEAEGLCTIGFVN